MFKGWEGRRTTPSRARQLKWGRPLTGDQDNRDDHHHDHHHLPHQLRDEHGGIERDQHGQKFAGHEDVRVQRLALSRWTPQGWIPSTLRILSIQHKVAFDWSMSWWRLLLWSSSTTRDARSCWEPYTVSSTGKDGLLSAVGKMALSSKGFWIIVCPNHGQLLYRTPAQFLEEVLLVDDFSDKEDLGEVEIIENLIPRFRFSRS